MEICIVSIIFNYNQSFSHTYVKVKSLSYNIHLVRQYYRLSRAFAGNGCFLLHKNVQTLYYYYYYCLFKMNTKKHINLTTEYRHILTTYSRNLYITNYCWHLPTHYLPNITNHINQPRLWYTITLVVEISFGSHIRSVVVELLVVILHQNN